jgi:hypothetical protein
MAHTDPTGGMGSATVPHFRTISLEDWHCEMSACLHPNGHIYFPVSTLCAVMRVQPARQRARLQSDEDMQEFLLTLPFPTAAGGRETLAINEDGVGFWILSIQSNRLRPELREQHRRLRRQLIAEARRIVMGDMAPSLPAPRSEVAAVAAPLMLSESYIHLLADRIGHVLASNLGPVQASIEEMRALLFAATQMDLDRAADSSDDQEDDQDGAQEVAVSGEMAILCPDCGYVIQISLDHSVPSLMAPRRDGGGQIVPFERLRPHAAEPPAEHDDQ